MSKRILWRSWSKLEAEFELNRIKQLPLVHEWVNGHAINPTANDVFLTTNGYDYRPGPHKKVTWYAESYTYLANEYNNYDREQRWDHRFHFNPNYASKPRSSESKIMTWWKYEKELFDKTVNNKKPKYNFGMVLSKKSDTPVNKEDFGHYRAKAVAAAKSRSFKYYGGGWDKNDPNYQGEGYVHGHRGTPLKFHDARILLADCKFVLCLENLHGPHYAMNYLTEKMWHGFLSASIPIYCGCWNIADLIDPSLYVDLRKFYNGKDYDLNACFDYCEKMPDSEYQGYLSRIGEFLNGKGQEFTCEQKFIELDQKIKQMYV